MRMWRFHYDGAKITFGCPQAVCMIWAHRFGKYMGRELVRIDELRPELRLV